MSEVPHLVAGDRRIGEGEPCFIIAEAGVNHNGSLEMALKLVDVAIEAGADAVKFQKRSLKDLYPADLLENPNTAEWNFRYMLPYLQKVELLDEDFFRIKEYCDEKGIRFMCTPWDETSLELLEEIGVEIYKIASADLVNFPLLDRIAGLGKPMILSTGMATLDEIQRTVDFLKARNASFALLHCVSTYPAPFENLNLRFIETLKQFGVPVGYSGHERGIAIPVVTLALGASIIEKHITLDRTLPGPDHPASLEPRGIELMIRDIRNAEEALGSTGKTLNAAERLNRQVLRKSLVAAHDLPAGTVITREMVTVKGPGKGLSPQYLDDLIGITLRREVRADDFFTVADIKPQQYDHIKGEGLRRTWGLKCRFHDLDTIVDLDPQLVELHFSEDDVDFPFEPPEQPYSQRLCIHAPEFADHRLLDMCSLEPIIRERSIAMIQQTIDKAVELRPHFGEGEVGLVIHVGGMSMDEPIADTERLLELAIDSFRQLDPKGITLLPENLPPRPWYFGGQWYQNVFIRAEEMIAICEALDVGMTLDISHAKLYCNWAGEDLADYVAACLPYTRHLHIADATGIDGEGIQVDEGEVDWPRILAVLSDADFTWVPEIWSGHLNNNAGFIDAVNRLAAYDVL
jgi:sialic acid synthase SpsE/sugar phosphate isomerase/epimerase